MSNNEVIVPELSRTKLVGDRADDGTVACAVSCVCMTFSETRFPLFGIMLEDVPIARQRDA